MIRRAAGLLLLHLLLLACTPFSAPTPQPAPPPTGVVTPAVEATSTLPSAMMTPTEAPTSQGLLTSPDCRPEAQRQAFRDDLETQIEVGELPLCYDLDFLLHDDGESFEAAAGILVRNQTEDAWPDLLFRLYPESERLFGGTIRVNEVLVDGQGVVEERVLADETGLRVPLEQPLAPGEEIALLIRFEGELAPDPALSSGLYGIFARTGSAATLASWFPLLAVWDEADDNWYQVPVLGEGDAVFSESALIRATLQAPARYELAVSGLIVAQEEEGGLVRHEVVTGPARDLTMVWMEEYASEEVEVDGTTLRHWYLPGDEEGGARAFDAARASLALFNERFGPYPFEELEIVSVPLSGAGGVEYPQLFLLGTELYRDRNSHDFLAFASSHETAHQWWYSSVGNDINAAPWQDEALTNWSALLWLEEENGAIARATADSWARGVERYEENEGEERVDQPLQAFAGRGSAYGTIVYLKGALFFDALRAEIGDEAYFAALQQYYDAHLFDIAEPADLLASFEETSGRELDALYEEWGVAP